MTFPGFSSKRSMFQLDKQRINTHPLDCDDTPPVKSIQYVFALGHLVHESPSVDIEKEWWQAMPGHSPGQDIDYQLEDYEKDRYITRQMCWILEIDDIYVYILKPRNETVFRQLLSVYIASEHDIHANQSAYGNPIIEMVLVVGTLGKVAQPCECNGLELPILYVDSIEFLHTFDRSLAQQALSEAEENATKLTAKAQESRQKAEEAQAAAEAARLAAETNSDDEEAAEAAEKAESAAQRANSRAEKAETEANDAQEAVERAQQILDQQQEYIDLFIQYRRKNTGQSDENRALNYVMTRELGIYQLIRDLQQAEVGEEGPEDTANAPHDLILTALDVEAADFGSDRKFYDVILSFYDASDYLTDKYFVRVDVTGKWPFRVGARAGDPPQFYRGHKFE